MFDLLKKYIENRIQLVKLELISILSNLAVGLISSFLLLIIGMFILLMFSFSLSFWIASLFDSYALGFASVGGIYILGLVIYILFIKKIVDTKVKDKIVRAAFAAEDELIDKDL